MHSCTGGIGGFCAFGLATEDALGSPTWFGLEWPEFVTLRARGFSCGVADDMFDGLTCLAAKGLLTGPDAGFRAYGFIGVEAVEDLA